MRVSFFNEPATTEIYTLSLHDALPISVLQSLGVGKGDRVLIYMPMIPEAAFAMLACARLGAIHAVDRKSTRLNSSHVEISYAVFCLKKKITKLAREHAEINENSLTRDR